MPDEDGKLTDEEKGEVEKWLENRNLLKNQCWACGQSQWDLEEHVITALRTNKTDVQLTVGASYPAVLITCRECSLMSMFSAKHIGII